MLGRDHALLGAAAYLGVAPLVERSAGVAVEPVQLAVGAAVCAGFCLWPDIDEPGSTVSRKLGPISEAISSVTNKVAGGHRKATHSLLFTAATWLGAHEALRDEWAVGALVFCAMALSLRMILPLGVGKSGLLPLGLTVAATVWVVHAHDVGSWLPWSCAAGVALHLVGDALTVEGVPVLWLPFVPASKHTFTLLHHPLGHTDSVRERILGSFLGLLILLFVVVNVIIPEGRVVKRDVPGGASVPSIHLPGVQVPHATLPNVGGTVSSMLGKLKDLR